MWWQPCQTSKLYWPSSCIYQDFKYGHNLMQKNYLPFANLKKLLTRCSQQKLSQGFSVFLSKLVRTKTQQSTDKVSKQNGRKLFSRISTWSNPPRWRTICWRRWQAWQQMRLQKRGGRRRGLVVTRAPSLVGGNTALLFLMLAWVRGGGSVLCRWWRRRRKGKLVQILRK